MIFSGQIHLKMWPSVIDFVLHVHIFHLSIFAFSKCKHFLPGVRSPQAMLGGQSQHNIQVACSICNSAIILYDSWYSFFSLVILECSAFLSLDHSPFSKELSGDSWFLFMLAE